MATKKKRLIEIAESADPGTGRPGPEAHASQGDRIDLALAYLGGDVTGAQVCEALRAVGYKIAGGNFGTVLSQALWTAVRQGIVKVSRVR